MSNGYLVPEIDEGGNFLDPQVRERIADMIPTGGGDTAPVLFGPGAPMYPETTNGVISGDEPIGTVYYTTQIGESGGIQSWQKRYFTNPPGVTTTGELQEMWAVTSVQLSTTYTFPATVLYTIQGLTGDQSMEAEDTYYTLTSSSLTYDGLDVIIKFQVSFAKAVGGWTLGDFRVYLPYVPRTKPELLLARYSLVPTGSSWTTLASYDMTPNLRIAGVTSGVTQSFVQFSFTTPVDFPVGSRLQAEMKFRAGEIPLAPPVSAYIPEG